MRVAGEVTGGVLNGRRECARYLPGLLYGQRRRARETRVPHSLQAKQADDGLSLPA